MFAAGADKEALIAPRDKKQSEYHVRLRRLCLSWRIGLNPVLPLAPAIMLHSSNEY
jgi:hypothetical protein